MINPRRSISEEIIDLIEWLGADKASEYERGILTGLRMAEQLAEAVERNSEVSKSDGNAIAESFTESFCIHKIPFCNYQIM